MFRIPEDLEQELQKKYPKEHVQSIILSLFQGLIEKTLKDGACHIREFGKFESFVTYSSKLNQNVVRFKFKCSGGLLNKIKDDEYLIANLPVKAKVPFTEQHLAKCNVEGIQEQKWSNLEARSEASKLGKDRTKEKLAINKVMELLEDTEDDQ